MTPDIRMMGVDSDNVATPKNDGSRGSALYNVPIKLSDAPDSRWRELFVNNWNSPPQFTTMHRTGIARVVVQSIHLNGTTIEEVEQYHKTTLELVVAKTNQQRNEERAAAARQQEAKEATEELHRRNVQEVVSRMNGDTEKG